MMNVLRIITVLVSYIYPAYATYQSLNVKVRSKYYSWQIYWIMYAIYASIVALTDHFFWWLPFYEEIKLLFIFWLLPTGGCGCNQLYNSLHGVIAETMRKCGHNRQKEVENTLFKQYDEFAVAYEDCEEDVHENNNNESDTAENNNYENHNYENHNYENHNYENYNYDNHIVESDTDKKYTEDYDGKQEDESDVDVGEDAVKSIEN